MKRFTLLFLALSSLTFAGVSTTSGNNPISVNGTGDNNANASAGINVNVSAVVTDGGTELYIADKDGVQISDVNFHHVLQAGDVNNQGDKTLTANLLVKGTALANAGTLDYNFGNGDSNVSASLALKNTTDISQILTSTLSANTGTITTNQEAPLTVTSTLAGDVVAGTYSTESTTLTVTYNKSDTSK